MSKPEADPAESLSGAFAEATVRSARLEAQLRRDPSAHRILTGDRPTGPLHLGHYFGTLHNRVRLQDLGVDLMVLVADYQTIIDRDSPTSLPEDVEALVADYLAVGIDPGRATIFAHSQIEALNQLLLPFLSLVSVAELSRNPTVKDEMAAAGLTSMSGLMFTYPVHQAADILFCKATAVPVGRDQLPHLELTRLIARRFNRRYSPERALFPEPAALLSDAPALLGTNGQKMSKSRGNAIAISATADETARLIAAAKTDPDRHITYDPLKRPEVANLVLLAALCQDRRPEDVASEIGGGGSSALKRLVIEAVNERFRGIRARRAELAEDSGYLRQVLREGSERAREIAYQTLQEVRRRMHTDYPESPRRVVDPQSDRPVYKRIADLLRGDIVIETAGPGEQVPSEHDDSDYLVSRSRVGVRLPLVGDHGGGDRPSGSSQPQAAGSGSGNVTCVSRGSRRSASSPG